MGTAILATFDLLMLLLSLLLSFFFFRGWLSLFIFLDENWCYKNGKQRKDGS